MRHRGGVAVHDAVLLLVAEVWLAFSAPPSNASHRLEISVDFGTMAGFARPEGLRSAEGKSR